MAKTTRYGVARGESIIGETFETPDEAKSHLAWVADQAKSIGLESDARLVTVEVTTTVGRPHVYKEPDDDAGAEVAPAADAEGAAS